MRTLTRLALSAGAVAALVLPTAVVSADPGASTSASDRAVQVTQSPMDMYIVVTNDEPLLEDFDQDQLRSRRATNKGRAMARGHDRIIRNAGVADSTERLLSYTNAINGFAISADLKEITRIAQQPEVARVVPSQWHHPTTDETPEFLGLTDEGGAWMSGLDGSGVVVGVIDTGIWPEHPSFADDGSYPEPPVTLEPYDYSIAGGFLTGTIDTCEFGTSSHDLAEGYDDADFACNNKLIGARQVLPAYRFLEGALPTEYDSARDDGGHGTHTASTAAGNADVPASIFGRSFGTVSGVAPRAHVIAYKALGAGGGTSIDLALAIDIAVADGVDVMNYSIGSSSPSVAADDIAFLFAADAGVHVATSNGNSGPAPATIGSPSSVPWLTSVGASTSTRTYEGTVTLGNGDSYTGASITPGTDQLSLVDAEDFDNNLCLPGEWPDGTDFTDQIVLCERGAIARIDKSRAVDEANGAGMVLFNQFDADSEVTDNHWIPSVHINNTDGLAIKDYIDAAGDNAVAQITGGEHTPIPGSSMAAFSSRGPNRLTTDIIKPDITAPGVNVLAGNTPTPDAGPHGEMFQMISGTSMSSPHVAGLMALLDQAHPDWSPAAVKSALMTTARQDVTKEDGATQADPFDMGAGHVDSSGDVTAENSPFNPGIVFDNDIVGSAAYACGQQLAIFSQETCDSLAAAGIDLDASEYNVASIGIGELTGTETVTRTVTNVAGRALNLVASIDAPDGVDVTVSPNKLTVPPGKTRSFQVTFTPHEDIALGTWAHGAITLDEQSRGDGKQYSAHVPLSVKAESVVTPFSISSSIADGGTTFPVSFGYDGAYQAVAHGLVGATNNNATVQQDPDQTFDPGDVADGGAVAFDLDVDDAASLRFVIPPDGIAPGVDLDMFVYRDGREVASSTNSGTDELVQIDLPADGAYTVYVHGWQAEPGGTDFLLQQWVLPFTDGPTLEVVSAPDAAEVGLDDSIEVAWPTDLESGDYLGAVSHRSDDGVEAVTILEVNG